MDDIKIKIQQALNKCYFFLKFRPRSKKEIADYLQKKSARFKWSQEVIDAAIKSLEEENLIDDKSFIEWYVNAKSKLKPKGERLLRQELRKLGIDQFLTDDFFAVNIIDEEKSAVEILNRRWSRWNNLDRKKRFEKAARLLQSRGYPYDIIRNVIEELEN